MNAKYFTLSLLASAMFAGMGVTPAMAQSTPRVDQSQAEISARIQQGITSGHITAQESPALIARERELARQEARVKADGRATPLERQRLREDLAALRAEVEEKMNNRVVAIPARTPVGANNTPGIDQSQAAISARIQQGITSGHITAQEAPALMQRERELVRQEARIKADGRATPAERERLRDDLAALRAEVERKMANNVVATPPAAQTPGIDNTGAQIHARIEQGIDSGRISRRESRILFQRERDIERREVRFKADGVVNSRERRQLQRELSSLSQDVERMIANDRRDRNRY